MKINYKVRGSEARIDCELIYHIHFSTRTVFECIVEEKDLLRYDIKLDELTKFLQGKMGKTNSAYASCLDFYINNRPQASSNPSSNKFDIYDADRVELFFDLDDVPTTLKFFEGKK